MTDLEIARQTPLAPIEDVACKMGLPADDLERYGKYIAKIPLRLSGPQKGRLILVTAITATKAGIGKTTVSIGLALGLNHIGKKAVVALREPSLGPCFGMKGGAAGGGHAQVLPMERINLHFTGDFHAITAAHNMVSALLDNYLYQHAAEGFGLKEVTWRRVLDVNDRSLRSIVTGLGPATNGIPAQAGFDITPASELMAILCLASSLDDLRQRVGRIILGYRYDGSAFTVNDLGATGAVMALLNDAVMPNLVQTTEQTPAIVHGGPFANIAHGCNSLLATKMALAHSEYTITEAGFGADLGAEKFYNILCRQGGLQPDLTVIVATAQGLKMHGGVALDAIKEPNLDGLRCGLANLDRHVANLRSFGQSVVVVFNRFVTDTPAEIQMVIDKCAEMGVKAIMANGWEEGGKGTAELAHEVVRLCEEEHGNFTFAYDLDMPILDKIRAIVQRIYRGKDVVLTLGAQKDIARLTELGYDKLPICIAKTQYSFSDDPHKLGAPEDFEINVRSVKVSAGAGFLVEIGRAHV